MVFFVKAFGRFAFGRRERPRSGTGMRRVEVTGETR
jgi:hypothetical protein